MSKELRELLEAAARRAYDEGNIPLGHLIEDVAKQDHLTASTSRQLALLLATHRQDPSD